MPKTSCSDIRLAIAALRRKPYSLFSRKHSANGKPIPIPFLADDGRTDVNTLDHGQVNTTITTPDGEVLCQICGKFITDEDTTFFLITNKSTPELAEEEWINLIEDDETYREIDDEEMTKVLSNAGPVHLYCGRISLRLCPAIEDDDPDSIIGWTSEHTASRVLFEEPNLWLGTHDRNYTIVAQVHPGQLVTLHELDEMIAELKANTSPASTNPEGI